MSGSVPGGGPKAEPNLTPILDMVFQLITFFMLVMNFKAAELDLSLRLPVIGSAKPPPEAKNVKLLVLNVQICTNCPHPGCDALATLQAHDVTVVGSSDHTVTHSLYVLDPDGNELELYIDVPDVDWSDPAAVLAPTKPLHI